MSTPIAKNSSQPIQLIVGLGNPGAEYENTRHNAGAWFAEALANQHNVTLRMETKFKGYFGLFDNCKLLIPTTFMNLSGQAVKAVANFYKIPVAAILVVHDELDFAAGIVKLKFGGGDNGHNGLKDIIANMHSADFHRLRLGIGRPADRNFVDYVLHAPSRSDKALITDAIERALAVVPALLTGNVAKAMQELHTT